MKKLSPAAFERARDYIKNEARPLERAAFEYFFEDAPDEPFIEALGGFRNPDGGFGRALEPDVRTPSSSALATGIALETLKELDVPGDHPLVQGALAFLEQTLDAERLVWRVIPPDANNYPHAPWWHDEDGSLRRTFDEYEIIPRAQLLALFFHFRAQNPPAWLPEAAERTVAFVESRSPLQISGDDFVYALRLAEVSGVPQSLRERLRRRLLVLASQIVTRDPVEWSTYSVPPLKLAPAPDSLAADLLAEDISRHLDYLIDHQTPEGAWEPTWTWSGLYPEAWAKARREWQGEITLKNLRSLKAYGRL